MSIVKANAITYEKFDILGQQALFTCLRIDRNTIPDGLYANDLRENGEEGYICEVRTSVKVNHAGTVITKKPITTVNNMDIDSGIMLTDNDYNFTGGRMSLEEFLKE